MIVVSDASPINVLIRIEHSSILHDLFDHVLIPPIVAAELTHDRTPEVVRTWIETPPTWLQVQSPSHIDDSLSIDGPGEREAISLAVEIKADLLLVDDRKARRAANERGLNTIGAIGVLELASTRKLINLPDAFRRIRETDFLVKEAILEEALRRDAAQRIRPS